MWGDWGYDAPSKCPTCGGDLELRGGKVLEIPLISVVEELTQEAERIELEY